MRYRFAGKKLSSSQNANNDRQKKWKDKIPLLSLFLQPRGLTKETNLHLI